MTTKIMITNTFNRTVSSALRNQRYLSSRTFIPEQKDLFWSSSSSSSSLSSQVLMEDLYNTTRSDINIDDDSYVITKITLNRPKANAMGTEMIQGLQNCLDILEEEGKASDNDNDINSSNKSKSNCCRCLVLTSSSEKVFSAGADLKERATMTEE